MIYKFTCQYMFVGKQGKYIWRNYVTTIGSSLSENELEHNERARQIVWKRIEKHKKIKIAGVVVSSIKQMKKPTRKK